MAQSNSNSAQREPSMEEILASIRRIIEDSDSARKGFDTPAGAAPTAERANDPVGEHAFRMELEDEPISSPIRETEAQAPNALQSSKPFEWGRDLGYRRGEPVAPAADDHQSVRPAEPATASPHGDEIEVELSLDEFASSHEDEAAAPEPENPVAGGIDRTRPAIISDRAGRQVAASFGELSAAFEARNRKSLDETAEEMLRPMLQDWLDNNLPHLVERLVREEIERIARGAAAPR